MIDAGSAPRNKQLLYHWNCLLLGVMVAIVVTCGNLAPCHYLGRRIAHLSKVLPRSNHVLRLNTLSLLYHQPYPGASGGLQPHRTTTNNGGVGLICDWPIITPTENEKNNPGETPGILNIGQSKITAEVRYDAKYLFMYVLGLGRGHLNVCHTSPPSHSQLVETMTIPRAACSCAAAGTANRC